VTADHHTLLQVATGQTGAAQELSAQMLRLGQTLDQCAGRLKSAP
jgi:hypothetical protein